MAKIHNTETIKRILDDAGIQTSHDDVPQELASKVVPVLISNPERVIKVRTGLASDVIEDIIFTSNSTKDTYIVGASLSIAKDVVSDATVTGIDCIPFNEGRRTILTVRYEPITVGSNLNGIIILPFPLKLSKETTIRIITDSATASIDITGTIYYYEIDHPLV